MMTYYVKASEVKAGDMISLSFAGRLSDGQWYKVNSVREETSPIFATIRLIMTDYGHHRLDNDRNYVVQRKVAD